MTYREELTEYVKNKYGADPEYLWRSYPDYAVFRHSDNNKWFGIVMNVPYEKLGLDGEDYADILNVKLSDPFMTGMVVQQSGYLRGYHMNKGSWISILLDGTVPFDEIIRWLEESYLVTASKEKKQENRPPKEWIIPANPKYYDIEHAFDGTEEIDWKQGSGIKTGDTVFIYVAAPVSAIMFKCLVTDTDIPYRYEDGKLQINALMRIRLQKRYDPESFTFEVLKEDYGIRAVRGPRGIPKDLSRSLR